MFFEIERCMKFLLPSLYSSDYLSGCDSSNADVYKAWSVASTRRAHVHGVGSSPVHVGANKLAVRSCGGAVVGKGGRNAIRKG